MHVLDVTAFFRPGMSATTLFFLIQLLTRTLGAPSSCSPVDADTLGKTVSHGGCSLGGVAELSDVSVEPWGIKHRPLYWPSLSSDWEVCAEEIVLLFGRDSKHTTLYHRPRTSAAYFAKRNPHLYKRFRENNSAVRFPCHSVPVDRVHVWRNRNRFQTLLRKMAFGIRQIRDANHRCEGVRNPWLRSISRAQLIDSLDRYKVTGAAINYLHYVAYSNYFCIFV